MDADPDNWWKTAENHIGNGPFRVTGIDENQRWTFEANENYWQGRPKLDGIEYVYIDDAAVALEAYRAGDLDISRVRTPQIPEVTTDPELSEQLVTYPLAATFTLAMNLTQEPFTDRKVREAFSYAIDRETLCAEVRSGNCSPTLSWIPEGVAGAIETDKYGFDPEAAVQALAESSYGGPEGLPEITLTVDAIFLVASKKLSGSPGEIRDILGVELAIEPVDGTTLIALRKDVTTHPQLLYFGGWYPGLSRSPELAQRLLAVRCRPSPSAWGTATRNWTRSPNRATPQSIPKSASPSTSRPVRFWSRTCLARSSSTSVSTSWSVQTSPAIHPIPPILSGPVISLR